jgi:hypothetical protein
MKRGFITHLATNGAAAIHDFELAFQCATCEDIEEYIKDGKFGNWKETAEFINRAASHAYKYRIGFGRAIGAHIYHGPLRREISIFAKAYDLTIPITVHKGIGYDITDQHPSADFAAIGWASGEDFNIFANSISKLEDGVFLNFGTQVMGPEVYLKALSMARNMAGQEGQKINHFTTAVFDIIDLGDWKKEDDPTHPNYYFRPKKTILIRTVKDGGESFYIQGDFRITIPALYRDILRIKGGEDGKGNKKYN